MFRKNWSLDVSMPTDVLLKLMDPIIQQGYNVTCDFSPHLTWHCDLLKRSGVLLNQCTKIRSSRESKKKKLHKTRSVSVW